MNAQAHNKTRAGVKVKKKKISNCFAVWLRTEQLMAVIN